MRGLGYRCRTENIYEPRIECECGRYNNTPSYKKRNSAKCRWCGLLVNKQELFKEKIKRGVDVK